MKSNKDKVKELEDMIRSNFKEECMHCVVGYPIKKFKKAEHEADENYFKTISKLEQEYEKEGIEFRSITVINHDRKSIHYHIICPSIETKGNIQIDDEWSEILKTNVTTSQIEPNGEYEALARYLIGNKEDVRVIANIQRGKRSDRKWRTLRFATGARIIIKSRRQSTD